MWISFKVIDGGAFMQVRKAAYQALTRYSFETMELKGQISASSDTLVK